MRPRQVITPSTIGCRHRSQRIKVRLDRRQMIPRRQRIPIGDITTGHLTTRHIPIADITTRHIPTRHIPTSSARIGDLGIRHMRDRHEQRHLHQTGGQDNSDSADVSRILWPE